jgi:hypothetical protein
MTDNENPAPTDRFPAWMALAVSSAVCLAASETKRNALGLSGSSRTGADNWVLSVEVLSMCFSFFSCIAYLGVAEHFIGKIAEICFVRRRSTLLSTERAPCKVNCLTPSHHGTGVFRLRALGSRSSVHYGSDRERCWERQFVSRLRSDRR